MEVQVVYDRPEGDEHSGPVKVGWFIREKAASLIFDPPERLRSAPINKTHAKSASRCPAVINLESRHFVIKCPFDLDLAFARDKDGKPGVRNIKGDASPVRGKKLAHHIHMVGEREWRYPDRPTLQLSLPYIFIADEPVYINQVAPYMHYRAEPWPGTLFGGRFPVNIWPRTLIWAFEWHDISRPISIQRGEPLFYAQFETVPQDRPIQLVEVEQTNELLEYVDLISGAVNYVNQTFSLFKKAEDRRPKTLLTEKRKP